MKSRSLIIYRQAFFENRTINPFTGHPISNGDEAYLTLVAILGQPPPLSIPELNSDIWYEIFMRMDAKLIERAWIINKRTYEVCNRGAFWKHRFEQEDLPVLFSHYTIHNWCIEYPRIRKITRSIDRALIVMEDISKRTGEYSFICISYMVSEIREIHGWMLSLNRRYFGSNSEAILRASKVKRSDFVSIRPIFKRNDDLGYNICFEFTEPKNIIFECPISFSVFRHILIHFRYVLPKCQFFDTAYFLPVIPEVDIRHELTLNAPLNRYLSRREIQEFEYRRDFIKNSVPTSDL